jgi:hypothetical protein
MGAQMKFRFNLHVLIFSLLTLAACAQKSEVDTHRSQDLTQDLGLRGDDDTIGNKTSKTDSSEIDYNNFVLLAVASMPSGGGYSTGSSAFRSLKNSITLTANDRLEVDNKRIQSFCSGATYLVFLKTLSLIQTQPSQWSRSLLSSLLVGDQSDGSGAWGRWNSNGPGTARFFFETGLGSNFYDWSQAKPGDFMKIWWSTSIGRSEHGHSVIFMGNKNTNGTTYVGIWSANTSNPDGTSGMGIKWYPKNSIVRALFSRLTHLSALPNV